MSSQYEDNRNDMYKPQLCSPGLISFTKTRHLDSNNESRPFSTPRTPVNQRIDNQFERHRIHNRHYQSFTDPTIRGKGVNPKPDMYDVYSSPAQSDSIVRRHSFGKYISRPRAYHGLLSPEYACYHHPHNIYRGKIIQ